MIGTIRSLAGLIVLGVLAMALFQACNKDEVLAPEDFAPPSALKALSRDGSVTVYWTASPTAGSSSFAGYRIVVTKTGVAGNIDSAQIGKTVTNYTVTSLVNGETYHFSVRSVKDNGDVSEAVNLDWGPTRQFTSVSIFEFDSPSPSGLQFSTGSTFSFTSSPPANDNRGKIDLWIDGAGNGTPLLKSPHDQTISTGWRTTLFVETSATGLDQQVDVPAIGSFRSTPGLTITPNKVYFAKTADGNYVRFTVSAVQGSAPNRFVSVTVAYNSGSGPWAKR